MSEVLSGDDKYDGGALLVDNPELVLKNSYMAFFSALWFHMTPQNPKPSIHEVATGFYTPNAADIAAGITSSTAHALTSNIINGGSGCKSRGKFFRDFLKHFKLPEETEADIGCDTQAK